MTKQQLRIIYRQKRKNITPNEKPVLDDLLLAQFKQMHFSGARLLLSYLPIKKHAEPDTALFSNFLQSCNPGLAIAYPAINNKTTTFDAVLVDGNTVYCTGNSGIREPWAGVVVNPQTISLVFAPLLACDIRGYRVGFGKGFFDKYLAGCSKDIIKVGFSYFGPTDNIDDTQPFDVPLNYLVTTDRVYEF